MSMEHYSQLFPAVCAGFGLSLIGGANLLLLHRGLGFRLFATLLALAVTVGTASAIDLQGVLPATLRLLALALIPVVLVSSPRLVVGLGNAGRKLNRPVVRFAFVTVAGLGIVVGSIANFEITDHEVNQRGLHELAMAEGPVASVDCKHAQAFTDRGSAVALKEPGYRREATIHDAAEERILNATQLSNQVIHRGPGGDQSNCHGWVFTGGRFRLTPDDVERILTENGYEEVHEPQPGDLTIYRVNGAITHSAIVRYVTEGQPILIEGKWGALGVMLHAVDKSVYGTNYTFYRSPRTGHLLVGVGGHAPTGEARPALASE